MAEIIARCQKCGRGFLSVGANDDMIDRYPPEGWRPEGGWAGWLGARDPRYPAPECSGQIEMLAKADGSADAR